MASFLVRTLFRAGSLVNMQNHKADKGFPTGSSSLKPAIFVMNLSYTGIGIARSVHSKGIEVVGVDSRKDAPGKNSRYLSKFVQIPNHPDAACSVLTELAAGFHDKPVIFPTRDLDVQFLDKYRRDLESVFVLPQLNGKVIMSILDKYELAQIADSLGISTPRVRTITTINEMEEVTISTQFPVIMKPRLALQWHQDGVWSKVGARKVIFAESPTVLRDEYGRIANFCPEVLVQEFVQGAENNIVVFCCYINQHGKLLGYFTGRKLRQNPPLFGTGCIVEACAVAEIKDISLTILNAVGYTGMAELEFKFDKQSGKFFLIEINPRHWDQHELGKMVGVNLTWLAYSDLVGQNPKPQVPDYSASPKWIAERELLLLVVRNNYLVLKGRKGNNLKKLFRLCKNSVRDFSQAVKGKKLLALFEMQDPLPALQMCYRTIMELGGFCLQKLVTKR